jgi:5-methylcytosine-specific restriction endonuclease McrA
MPAHKKPTPLRYCEECEKPLERKRLPNGDLEYLIHFNRRKFCDQRCMGLNFDRRHSPDVGWSAAHSAARSLVPMGPCVRCGKPQAKDVHHKDGNFQNNTPTNLERICRSCHNREHKQKGSCVICGKPQKGLGYCEMHYQRFKKHGDPLAIKDNQFVPVRKEGESHPQKGCKVLDCTGKYHAKGYCSKHAQQATRGTLGQRQMTKAEASLVRWKSAG